METFWDLGTILEQFLVLTEMRVCSTSIDGHSETI